MLDPTSILFITLDSCRYDTFESTGTPNLDAIGPLYKAMAPGNFTFGSHAAMFVGFTPGIAERAEPLINPKFGKIFKMVGGGFPGKGTEFMTIQGKNIVEGLGRMGYTTIGTGSVAWFDDATETAQALTKDFHRYRFAGNCWSLGKQLDWIDEQLADLDGKQAFVFLNVGETHVPYWHEGADWKRFPSPCHPFGSKDNDADECRRRQVACLKWVDAQLAPLIDRFAHANTLVCADHGDAWGEDGLWEHGIHHRTVLEVPLLFRLQHAPEMQTSAAESTKQAVKGLARKVRDKLS